MFIKNKFSKYFDQFVDFISGSFSPFLGVLAGLGILKGILSFISNFGFISSSSGIYEILYAASDSLFYFLPVALAVSAAFKLKINPYTAFSVGAALLYPGLISALDKGLKIGLLSVTNVTYATTVIPILLAVLIIKIVEPKIYTFLPSSVRDIFTPLIVISIMIPLTLIVIGPIGNMIGGSITTIVMSLYSLSPLMAGAVLAGLWQILVIFGLHWAFIPVMLLNLSTNKFDPLAPILLSPVMAQSGAAFGAYFKFLDQQSKNFAITGMISALLGITEPVVYGITLKYRRPMILASIVAALGGGVIALMGVKGIAFSLPSVLALSVHKHNVIFAFISGASVFVLSAILVNAFGFTKKQIAEGLSNDNN